LRLSDLDETARDERRGRRETEAPRARGRQTAQLKGQAGGGPAAAEVVVEVAVEPLESRVEVGRHRDEQQFHIERGQAERGGQFVQDRPGRGRDPVTGDGARRGGLVEDPLDLLGREVLAPVRVVRVGVDGAARGHRLAHPLLDEPQPRPEVVVGPAGLRAGQYMNGLTHS
jgi:hypothetical protein